MSNVLLSSLNANLSALQTAQGNAVRSSDPDATYESRKITTKTSNNKTTGFEITPPQGYVNNQLSQSIRNDISALGYNESMLSKFRDLEPLLGQVNSPSSFTALFERFQTTLSNFATSPDNESIKSQLVSISQQLTTRLNELETKVQNIRDSCEKDIDLEVKNLTKSVNIVIEKNNKIKDAVSTGESISALEDSRRGALNEIARALAISVTNNPDGSVNVNGPSGINLASTQGTSFVFERSETIDASVVYPDTLKGLMINNQDVTTIIKSVGQPNSNNQAKLSALFELRDDILPNLSQNISQLARNLKEELNEIHNNASGFPGAQLLKGTKEVLGTDTFFGTGNARIATLNKDGIIQHFVDIDVSALGNVNAIVGAINAGLAGDATASIVDGKLNIKGNNGSNIAINENTSQMLDPTIKVGLYDTNGAEIGIYNFNPGVSLANTVTAMNVQFGANAVASLDNNKIYISALNNNKLKLNDYPLEKGTTIRSKGLSSYFGLNDFFVASTNPLSPSTARSIKLNPTLNANPGLISISSLDLTAGIGQRGTTARGIPRADGNTPTASMRDALSNEVLFHGTGNIGSTSSSVLNYSISLLSNISMNSNISEDKVKNNTESLNSSEQEFQKKARKSIQEISLIIAQLQHVVNTISAALAKQNELDQRLANVFSR
ncbi:MAG: hypothetical protein Q8L85_06955 [Alphaproteobacteria bacterium]|nr:hypothetical protein [Alphaproteobacteria bacterium]